MIKYISVYFVFCIYLNLVKCYVVDLTNSGPVVAGATINFKAELFNHYRQKINPDQYFIFKWRDDALPPHKGETSGYTTESYWNTSYSMPGSYEVEVSVYVSSLIFENPIISARQHFKITLMLNGNMALEQSNSTIESSKPYVSTTSPVVHEIALSEPDASYINRSATYVLSYWFVDCVYYGMSDDLHFSMNYTGQVDQEKHVEALVIASYEQPTPSPPTDPPTTTVPPNSTSTLPPTTPASNMTEPTKAVTSSNSTAGLVATTVNGSSSAANSTDIHPKFVPELLRNVSLVPGKNYSGNHDIPYICVNSTIIPLSSKETYGYFERSYSVKDPVQNLSFTGTNWLKQGDMLNLGVNCNGSSPFFQCVFMHVGEYNVTGNETCDKVAILTDCKFSIVHYFRNPETYTLVIIINNEVSKLITPVAVNIYKVTKKPQISVIIVPVACSAIAVIMIVFGIAYYIQSRNRYTIEVANFDFAQTSDMEYKTFSERLRDAMSNAINRTQDYVEEGNVWSPSRKYGSMQ